MVQPKTHNGGMSRPASRARLAANVKTSPLQQGLRDAKRAASTLKEKLHEVCVPKNGYPGKPDEYSYVPGFCVHKKGKGQPRKVVKKDGTISAEATRREIAILEKELKRLKHHPDVQIVGENIRVAMSIFSAMLDTHLRAKHPNPLERFDKLTALGAFEKTSGGLGTIPRHTIFTLLHQTLKWSLSTTADVMPQTGAKPPSDTSVSQRLLRPPQRW